MLNSTLSNLFIFFHVIHVFIPPFQNSSLAVSFHDKYLDTQLAMRSLLSSQFVLPPFLFYWPTTRIFFFFSPLSDACLARSSPAHCIPKASAYLLLQALNTFYYELVQQLYLLFLHPLSLAMMHETFLRLTPVSLSTAPLSFCLSLEPGKVSITLHHLSPMKNTDNSKRKEVNVSHPRVREFVNILSLTETETIALGNKNDRLYQTRACLCEDSVQDSDGKTVVLNSDFGLV